MRRLGDGCYGYLTYTNKVKQMSSNAIKVLLLGPTLGGKTTLANFLSDAKDSIGPYRPTVGCRILELQLDLSPSLDNKGLDNREIQLWDCAGDPKFSFNNCMAALANEASAVLFAYDANSEDQAAQLEEIYNAWNNHLALNPSTRYLLVARKWSDVQQKKRTIKAGPLARLSHVEWDIDHDGARVHTEFGSFIGSVLSDLRRKREEDEITILRE